MDAEETGGGVVAVDDLVQVWVPRAHLAEVYALVARLEAEREEVEHADAIPEKRVDGGTGKLELTPEEIEAGGMAAVELRDRVWSERPELLKRMYLESPDTMLRVMNFLADNTHRWIHTDELHAEIAPGRTSNRSHFGPFGRRVKGRYKMPVWPFAGKVGETGQPGLAYRMGEKVAEQISSYRKDV